MSISAGPVRAALGVLLAATLAPVAASQPAAAARTIGYPAFTGPALPAEPVPYTRGNMMKAMYDRESGGTDFWMDRLLARPGADPAGTWLMTRGRTVYMRQHNPAVIGFGGRIAYYNEFFDAFANQSGYAVTIGSGGFTETPAQRLQTPSYRSGVYTNALVTHQAGHRTGVVKDDGLPGGTLQATWSQVDGPGTAIFADPNAASTLVTFTEPGEYTLKLAGTDGRSAASATVVVTATAIPPVINESTSGTPSASYTSPWESVAAINDGIDPAQSNDALQSGEASVGVLEWKLYVGQVPVLPAALPPTVVATAEPATPTRELSALTTVTVLPEEGD